jgi:hypothetical protein
MIATVNAKPQLVERLLGSPPEYPRTSFKADPSSIFVRVYSPDIFIRLQLDYPLLRLVLDAT